MARWHVSGWRAVLLAPVLIPVALLLRLLPLKQTTDRTPAEVARFIRDFLADGGGEWDWDDFTGEAITNPWLDRIREEADAVPLPADEAGLARLEELLRRVEALGR